MEFSWTYLRISLKTFYRYELNFIRTMNIIKLKNWPNSIQRAEEIWEQNDSESSM